MHLWCALCYIIYQTNKNGGVFICQRNRILQEKKNVKKNILEEDLDKSSSLKRDIADLQVHDFIVGNPDRHMKNITYRFDENGKICGLMGIDNDTCFGENYIANNSSLRSVSPDQMGIITANTAKKILALDENTLRNSLYGFDLTVKAVDGAIERLKIMKDVIKTSVKYYDNNKIPDGKLIPGVPRIVEEKDLDKYSFEKGLISFRAEKQGEKTKAFGNTFAAVYSKMMEKQTVINDVRKSNLNRLNEFSDNVLTTGIELYNTAKKNGGYQRLVSLWFQSIRYNA